MEKIDRVINYFRLLREEGMMTSGVAVNKVGDGGFTGRADPKGPVAGFDPVMKFVRRRKNGDPDFRMNPKYKTWVRSLTKSTKNK